VNVKTTILTSHKLLQQAERELKAARTANAAEALASVLDILREQRKFDSVALQIFIGDDLVKLAGSPEGPAPGGHETATPIKIGGRMLGELRVRSERAELSYPDEVLLKQVAKLLARFLPSNGKVLVRHAREAHKDAAEKNDGRKLQPVSERRASAQKAAVGAAARR
jgi:hypothetical protein